LSSPSVYYPSGVLEFTLSFLPLWSTWVHPQFITPLEYLSSPSVYYPSVVLEFTLSLLPLWSTWVHPQFLTPLEYLSSPSVYYPSEVLEFTLSFLPLWSTWVHPQFLMVSMLFIFSLLCLFTLITVCLLFKKKLSWSHVWLSILILSLIWPSISI
jgi:hypothetical protein